SFGVKEKRTLKRASMRFWLGLSAVLLTTACTEAVQRNASRALHSSNHSNEWKLAGLLPGRTSIPRAETLLGNASKRDSDNPSAMWRACGGDELIVDVDDQGIVQSVRAARGSG